MARVPDRPHPSSSYASNPDAATPSKQAAPHHRRQAAPDEAASEPDEPGRSGRGGDTRTRLIRAALTLFVARGVNATTTREIALAAGIAEGTIYRHFASKDEMAWKIFCDHHVRLAEALARAHAPHGSLRDKVRAIVNAYCRMADEDWLLFSYHLLAMHNFLSKLEDDLPNPVSVVRDVLAAAASKGEIACDDIEVTTAMLLGIILQPAFHKVYGNFDQPLGRHAERFTRAVWQVLGL